MSDLQSVKARGNCLVNGGWNLSVGPSHVGPFHFSRAPKLNWLKMSQELVEDELRTGEDGSRKGVLVSAWQVEMLRPQVHFGRRRSQDSSVMVL